VKEALLNDNWWMKVDYVLAFTVPIYDVLKKTNTYMATLHFFEVRKVIFQHERKTEVEYSSFFEIVN